MRLPDGMLVRQVIWDGVYRIAERLPDGRYRLECADDLALVTHARHDWRPFMLHARARSLTPVGSTGGRA